MNPISDWLYRGPLSSVEYDAWSASDAGQIVLNRTPAQQATQFLLWPVYFLEGVIAVLIGFFPGRHGGQARLPDDWMLGHRGIPPAHMTPKELARSVLASERRQLFWLIILSIVSGILALLFLVLLGAVAKQGVDGLVGALFVSMFAAALLSGFVAGIAVRFSNARRNMIRFKRTAAYLHVNGGAHGQSRDVPLGQERQYA